MLSVLQESPVVDRPNSVAAKPIVPRPKKHRLAANFSVNVSDIQWGRDILDKEGKHTRSNGYCIGTDDAEILCICEYHIAMLPAVISSFINTPPTSW